MRAWTKGACPAFKGCSEALTGRGGWLLGDGWMAGWAGGGGCGGPSPPLHQLPQVRAYLPASLPLDITDCRAWLNLASVCLWADDDAAGSSSWRRSCPA